MSDMGFIEALPIVGNGFAACLACGALGGLLGVHVVLRRVVFASMAIAQVSSLGLAGALLIPGVAAASEVEGGAPTMLSIPGAAAVAAAMAAAAWLGASRREGRLTRETGLGIGYALPAGLVLLILDHMAGESHMVENVLFGNTVFVPGAQLAALAATALALFALHALLGRAFLAAAFDTEFAAAAGLQARWHDLAFYLSLAVALAVMIGSIGVLPVFGLMIMPAAAALLLAGRATGVLGWAVAIGLLSAAAGFYASFIWSLPTGPTILAAAGLALVPAWLWSRLVRS